MTTTTTDDDNGTQRDDHHDFCGVPGRKRIPNRVSTSSLQRDMFGILATRRDSYHRPVTIVRLSDRFCWMLGIVERDYDALLRESRSIGARFVATTCEHSR